MVHRLGSMLRTAPRGGDYTLHLPSGQSCRACRRCHLSSGQGDICLSYRCSIGEWRDYRWRLYIVVAIGGHYGDHTIWKPTPDMNTTQKRLDGYIHENNRIASASSIVVAGAGFTGVEVAGEIKSAYPHIQVTLVGTLVYNNYRPNTVIMSSLNSRNWV